ncbi:DNA polymerase beta superfamily protein [Tundrisphaera sp. TA3]|uniref:DNA polymerase beta superfamily protein n=1 Tax=Tundrisphaera sp. TA3 TaxID=3435775 RepID=UPI003EBD26FC
MKTLVKMQFGSHVYGTNVPSSDQDFKAVHLPDGLDILLQRPKNTINVRTKLDSAQKNTADDVDFESFSLQQYLKLLLEGQTVALTMLFTPDRWIIESSPEWELIRENKARFLHRGVSAFAGYCRQQANKYGVKGSRVASSRAAMTLFARLMEANGSQAKLKDHWHDIEALAANPEFQHMQIVEDSLRARPELKVRMLDVCSRKVQEHVTVKEAHKVYKHLFDEYGQRALLAEKNEGVDWKAMMHATRVCREAEELLLTHSISYPRPEAGLLLQIRKGELPYKQVAELLEAGLERLGECQRISTLPEHPDRAFAESLVAGVYRNRVLERAA